jgi:hypothetical protein
VCQPPNKQLQRTVTRRRGDGASAPFHYALAPRVTRQRAAAELRRWAATLERVVSLKNRADYDRAFAVVRKAINAWDPYGVIGGGGPLDEWNSEVALIVAQIPRISSPRDAAHAVARTFAGLLDHTGLGPEDCEAVGAQIFQELVSERILDPTSSPAA